MLINAILPRASDPKFAIDLRVLINTLISICASWEIFAVLARVHERAFLSWPRAVGEVLALHQFLLLCVWGKEIGEADLLV